VRQRHLDNGLIEEDTVTLKEVTAATRDLGTTFDVRHVEHAHEIDVIEGFLGSAVTVHAVNIALRMTNLTENWIILVIIVLK